MASSQNGRNSQVSGRRPRSARSRGLRTLQHQGLARPILAAIDAEIWLRALIVERAGAQGEPGPPISAGWATKDQVHDEALAWFLSRGPRPAARVASPAAAPATALRGAARNAGRQDVTFWVDSRLLARARRLADRQGLRVASLLEQALGGYVQLHVPAEVLRLHRRTQQQALRLHTRRSTATIAERSRSAILRKVPNGLKKRLRT
jgi:hypothetical protein